MVMVGPLVVLATLAVIGGFLECHRKIGWFHHFLHFVTGWSERNMSLLQLDVAA